MQRITVRAEQSEYPVWICGSVQEGIAALRRRFTNLNAHRQAYLLTSPEIWSLWGSRFSHAFGDEPVILFLPQGERWKRMREVERLAGEMVSAGADRSSVLFALGGGVVGDVCGFLAAIYMRGIDYIQIPTTLLAQVDSSVGGKTGVNLAEGKNLVGSFYPPKAVVAPMEALSTLPPRELRAGLYESIKAGLVRNLPLFHLIERHREQLKDGNPKILEKVVAASVRMKAEVVQKDEHESGVRMILNFGHTLGHAIESGGRYAGLLHGEAIAWGMLAALEISKQRGWLREADRNRAADLIRFFDPPAPPRIDPARLLSLASRDKKNRGGTRHFILLKGLGRAAICDDVQNAEIVHALEACLPRKKSGPRSAATRTRG